MVTPSIMGLLFGRMDVGSRVHQAAYTLDIWSRENIVNIVRVYSGDDGESHLEDWTPDQFAEIVNNIGPGGINITRRQGEHALDYHTAPRHQYVVNLVGITEIEVADGTKRQLGPGDVLVAEDLTGHGHMYKGLTSEERLSLAVPLA